MGGRPEYSCFDLPGFEDGRWVDWLCWVDDHLAEPHEFADYETLSFARFRDSDIVPDNTLIIGCCCRDDLLLLVLDGEDRGKVQYKQVGELPGFSRQTWRDDPTLELYPLADSFENFLELLHGE